MKSKKLFTYKQAKIINLTLKTLRNIFLFIGMLLLLKAICSYLAYDTQKSIDYCVSQGNTYDYCEREVMRYES